MAKGFKPTINGLQQLKIELREVQGKIIEATDPKEIERLTIKAGELRDKFNDVNEQINLFASGSKYEQAGNAIGEIESALVNLDFEKAAQRAESFATVAKSITFADAVKSFKDLGSAFVTIGKTILTNPLFLVAAVIAGIIVWVIKLMDKFGILKKIVEGLESAFNTFIDTIEYLLGILGGVSGIYKELESSQKRQEAQISTLNKKSVERSLILQNEIKLIDEKIKAQKREDDLALEAIEFEIRKRTAAGKAAGDVEKQKLQFLIDRVQREIEFEQQKTEKLQFELEFQAQLYGVTQEKILESLKRAGVDGEKIRKNREQKEQELNDALRKAQNDLTVFEIEQNKKRFDDFKKRADERIALNRRLIDLQIANLTDEEERRRAAAAESFRRDEEDLKKSLDARQLSVELYNAFLLEARKKYNNEINALEDQQAQREKERQEKLIAEEKERQEFRRQFYGNIGRDIVEKQIRDEQELYDARIALANATTGILTGLQSLVDKNSAASKVLALSEIAAQTAIGIVQGLVVAQKAAAGTGPAAALAFPIFYASQIAAILAAAGKAKQILQSGNTGGVTAAGGRSGGGGGSSQSPVPSFNLFGNPNNLNEQSAAQSVESGSGNNQMIVRAVISETDLNDSANRMSKIRQMSEL